MNVIPQAGVVVVGGGHAGIQVADSVRAADPDIPIAVIADESHLPYQRPPLSKSLWDADLAGACLPLRPMQFFEENRIQLVSDTSATSIDRQAQTVTLASGENLAYAALVLATGARAREIPFPGLHLGGVHTLRTLADGIALQRALREARSLVVIGGGFIGLEVAAAAADNGIKTTVLEVQSRVLQRAVSPQASEWLSEYHLSAGTDIRLTTTATSILGSDGTDEWVRAVRTAGGDEVLADVVVLGAGAVPNVELAAQSGLRVDDGIVVDATLRSSDPAVWAVGDCARFPGPHSGANLRLESVQNATDQARCVGRNVVAALDGGYTATYSAVPWFWSHQGSVRLQIAGVANRGADDVVIRRHSDAKVSFLSYEDDKLTVVESINAPADHMAARKLLATGARVDRSAAANSNAPLKSLVGA